MARLVILDRDGVINEDSDDYVKSPEEWHPIDGSLEAIARLNQADYRVVVVTNQAGLARGLFDFDALHRMHEKMLRMLANVGGNIDAVFFCPHRPEDDCRCRKPKTGLLDDVAERFQVNLNSVPFIGDSLKDIQAAKAVGAQPMLVKTGKGERTLAALKGDSGVAVYDNLAMAVDALLRNKKKT